MYTPDVHQLEELKGRFTYHQVHADQPERYQEIRAQALGLATTIVSMTPLSREQAVALTKLQEVVMWANAAIAIHESGER